MADRIFRREKRDPKSDFWHVIRVGLVLCMLIFLTFSAVGGSL